MNSKENERPQRCSTVFDGSEPVAWNCPPETLLTLEDWKWVDEMCRRHAELCSLDRCKKMADKVARIAAANGERCPVDAVVVLRRHQWSGTAYGNYGSTARRCPECGGIHPDDSLNNGGGNYLRGTGHRPGCELAAAIDNLAKI